MAEARRRRALFIKTKHLGDSVILTAAIEALPEDFDVDVFVFSGSAPILAMNPRVGVVETVQRHLKPIRRFLADVALLRRLRARRYDLLVQFSDDWRGAIIARLAGARLSVARQTQRRGRFWQASFDRIGKRAANGWRHAAEADVDLLRRADLFDGPHAPAYRLVPPAPACEEARRAIADAGLERRPVIVLHPATRWRFKAAPDRLWSAVADRLAGEGYGVILTGDAADRGVLEAIRAGSRSAPAIVTGSIPFAAALLKVARLTISVDSFALHLSAAVGTPVVAVFGPSFDRLWGPWRVAHRIVAADEAYPCRPCGIDGCGGSKVSQCLVTLPPEAVLSAVRELLAETDRPGATVLTEPPSGCD